MTPTLTAVVIAKNEADMIANCLDTLKWCDEIVVIDHHSEDATPEIARRQGARVVTAEGTFADIRTAALKYVKTDWLLYIDADERVTPVLAAEVRKVLERATHAAYAINRTNVHYGQHLEHGGWEEDWDVRLFDRVKLERWSGDIHEHAVFTGTQGKLTENMVHFTHRDVISGLIKTSQWTPIEARLLVNAPQTPKVTVRLILRKTVMEFYRRLVQKRGYKDGIVGWIEAMIQAMNRMLVYIQVWELQQQPSLPEKYAEYERSIVELWKRVK